MKDHIVTLHQILNCSNDRARHAVPVTADGPWCVLLQQDFVVRLQLANANSGDLPASAFDVQNGEVTSVSPVAGSNGRLYDVGVHSNLREETVSISTAAGATLASGLALAASNRIRVQVDTTRPQVLPWQQP